MRTSIPPVTVITAPSIRAYGYRRLVAGLMIGAALALAWQSWATRVPVIDPRMEVACGTWPRYEAEQLTIVVIGGKVHCWNNLHRRGE